MNTGRFDSRFGTERSGPSSRSRGGSRGRGDRIERLERTEREGAFRGRGRGFHRGFGERSTEPERRVEEESAPDSQDLSSAASLDRDSGSSNEESGLARRHRRRRPRKAETETNGKLNVETTGGPRVNQNSKEIASAETAKVSSATGANNAGLPQRDQRSRFESKTSSCRKQASDSKTHEDTINGTSA